jgi:hypothetical protein
MKIQLDFRINIALQEEKYLVYLQIILHLLLSLTEKN